MKAWAAIGEPVGKSDQEEDAGETVVSERSVHLWSWCNQPAFVGDGYCTSATSVYIYKYIYKKGTREESEKMGHTAISLWVAVLFCYAWENVEVRARWSESAVTAHCSFGLSVWDLSSIYYLSPYSSDTSRSGLIYKFTLEDRPVSTKVMTNKRRKKTMQWWWEWLRYKLGL